MSEEGFNIKTETVRLYEQSINVSQQVKQMKNHFQIIEQKIYTSAYYWKDSVSDNYRQYYCKYKEELDRMMSFLNIQTEMLKRISKNYEQAEMEVETLVEYLPSNVIS